MAWTASTRRCQPPHSQGLSLRNYNIRNSQGFGLTQAIWLVQIGSFEVMLLTKIKITSKSYCLNRLDYDVIFSPEVTTVTGGAQGGVSLVVRERTQGWSIQLTRLHGYNMVICEVVSGARCPRLL